LIVMENNRRNRLYRFILSALFAALVAVGSYLFIPLPFTPVPINLALLAVYLAGGLLGPKYGSLSLAVYVLLGAVGLPVFTGFTGGLSIIAGPTGGYIIGYIWAALAVGLIAGTERKPAIWRLAAAVSAGLIACYAFGTVWFMISTKTGFVASLMLCVVPFLIGDALKIIAAIFLIRTLRRVIPG
jgi:biotin transport system substrate-specific component